MNRLSSEENENTESVIPDFSSKILESSALKTFFQKKVFKNRVTFFQVRYKPA